MPTPEPKHTGLIYRCRAVLFDMDGVLVDSTPVIERVWQRWADQHGLPLEPLLLAAHGRRTRDTLAAVSRDYSLAIDVSRETAWLDQAEWEDEGPIGAIPGAAEFVESLPPDSWTVVTSSGRDLARKRLAKAGIPEPRLLFSAEAVTRGKPAPDGYVLAAQSLGIPARECVVFEDTAFGVAAGRAAGATAIGIATTFAPSELSEAAAVVPDFRAVRAKTDSSGLVIEVGQ